MSNISTRILLNDHILNCCLDEISTRYSKGQKIRVRVDEKPMAKGMRQLGYVWACIYPFLQGVYQRSTGERYDIDAVLHPYHVELFLKQTDSEISSLVDIGHGEHLIQIGMSSWKAGPMSSYIDWILRFYAVRGIYIPEADQYWNLSLIHI